MLRAVVARPSFKRDMAMELDDDDLPKSSLRKGIGSMSKGDRSCSRQDSAEARPSGGSMASDRSNIQLRRRRTLNRFGTQASRDKKSPGGKWVIMPDETWWIYWTYLTVASALITAFIEPFKIAFTNSAGEFPGTSIWSIQDYIGTAIFWIDLTLRFFVANHDNETGTLATDLKSIRRNYVRPPGMFWWDLLFAFPLDWIALLIVKSTAAGKEDPKLEVYVSCIKFIKMGRLYRVLEFFAALDKKMVISDIALMLIRNWMYLLLSSHWAACIFYLIARLESFSPDSWVGRASNRMEGVGIFDRYIYSLYVSTAAFVGSLGDDDFYEASVVEAIFMIVYCLLNVVLSAYILGTVTMLMVKFDERSKMLRDQKTNLMDFRTMHGLDDRLYTAMHEHLELHFRNEQTADDRVLAIYPATLRRKVLRALYRDRLKTCHLFRAVTDKFLDALLAEARIELHMPRMELLNRGDVAQELCVILEGEVVVVTRADLGKGAGARSGGSSMLLITGHAKMRRGIHKFLDATRAQRAAGSKTVLEDYIAKLKAEAANGGAPPGDPSFDGGGDNSGGGGGSGYFSEDGQAKAAPTMKELLATSTKTDEEKAGAIMTAMFKTARGDNQAGVSLGVSQAPAARATQEQVYFDKRGEGESFGEASFFTDTPSHEAVMTCSVVRLLLVSRATFEGLLDQFPIAGRSMMEEVLHDCDERIEDELAEIDPEDRATIINTIMVMSNRRSEKADLLLSQLTPRQTARLDMLRNVKRGVQLFSDQHDDQRTAKLLSHVAKNNIHEVKTLLSQGMSPDAASHPDARTGLHIASAEGHTHMARLLLESGANPMVCDRFVRTPLLEAARNGHDDMLALLREYKASLRTDNLTTAVELCGAISNGDLMYVRRLLRAGVDPEMTVTDMRTALHIAAAEGDLRSVKVLVEEGAALIDLTDRWGQTPLDNAKAAGAHAVVAYLQPMMDTATELRAACNDQQRVASWLRAAATGDLSTINTMITQRINPDVTSRTHGGRTALMLAVEAGHEAVATRLLEYDASTATRDVSGVTALFYAARAGHDDLVMDLLAHGITLSMDPQVVSYHMCAAAADVAAGDQSVRRMRILRTAGADPLGVLITAGTSPLHVAAGANNVPAVKYLLMECGADAGGLNASGLTPRQLAQATGAADADAVLATWLGARSGPRASGSGMARMRGVSFCGSRLQSLAEVGATTTGSPSAAVARIWSKEGATGKPVPAMRPPFGSTSSDTPPLSTCDSDASHSRASAASSAPQHQQQWGTFRSVDPVTGALTSSSGAPPPPPLPFNIASAAARASPTFGARGSPSRMGGAYVGDRGRDPDFATASANSLNSPSSSTPLLGAPAAVPLLVNDSDDTSSCPSTPTNATASTPLLLAMGGGGSRIGRGGRGASLMMPSSSRPGSPAPFSGSAARATPLVPLPLPPLPLPAPAAVHVVSPLPRSSHPSAAAAAVSDSANSVQGVGGAALASALPSRSMLGSTGSAAGQDQQDGVAAAAAEAAVAAAAAGMLGAVRGGVGLEGDVDADGGADALEEQQQQGSSSSSAAPAMPAGGVAQVPPVVLAASSPTPHAAVAHVEAASSAAAAESAAADAATAGVRDALADMVHELGHVTAVSVADRDRDRWPSPVGGVAVVLADLDAMVEEIGNARSYDGRM